MWIGLSAGAYVLFFSGVLGFLVQLKLALGGRNVVAVFGMSEAISSDIGSPCFGWGFLGFCISWELCTGVWVVIGAISVVN